LYVIGIIKKIRNTLFMIYSVFHKK